MALQATFAADFTSFERALASAAESLKGFELPVKGVQASLTNMAKDFSGANVISQAEKMAVAVQSVGGASALTEKEQARVNATVTEAIAKYERLGKEVPNDLRKLADQTQQLEQKTSGWSTAAGTVASALGNLAANALSAIGSMAWDAVKGGVIDFNAQLETSKLQFETLTGSADRAEQIVKDLFEFAKSTPFETTEIINAARLMETFGGSTLNTKENLRLFGDAAAATGAPLEQVSMWVSRMYANMAANKPIGESIQNLTMLGVIGPKAATALTEVAGSSKTTSEKFAVMQEALVKFSGAMEKQAGTWGGLMSTFNDTVTMTLGTMGKPIFDALKEITKKFNDFVGSDDVQAFIATLGKEIGSAIADTVDAVRSVISTIGDLVDGFQRANDATAGLLAPVAGLGTAYIGAAAAIGPLTTSTSSFIASTKTSITSLTEWSKSLSAMPWKEMVASIGESTAKFTGLDKVMNAFKFGEVNKGFLGLVTSLWSTIPPLMAGVTSSAAFAASIAVITSPVTLVVGGIALLTAGLITLLGGWDEVAAAFSLGWQVVQDLATVIGDYLVRTWNEFTSYLTSGSSIIDKAWTAITDLAGVVTDGLGGALEWVIGHVQDFGEWMLNLIPASVVSAIQELSAWVGDRLGAAFSTVTGWITGFFDAISGVVEWVGKLLGKGKEWIDGLHAQAEAIRGARDKSVEHKNTIVEVAAAATSAVGSFKPLTEETNVSAEAAKKAAEAAKKLEAELKKLTGQDKIEAAADMAAKVKAIGGASELAADQVAPVHKLMGDAIAVVQKDGGVIPTWMIKIFEATRAAKNELNTYVDGVPKLGQAYQEQIPSVTAYFDALNKRAEIPPTVIGIPGWLGEMGEKIENVVPKVNTMNSTMTAFGSSMTAAAQRAVEGGGSIAGAMSMAASSTALDLLEKNKTAFGALSGTISHAAHGVQSFANGWQVAEQTGSKAMGALTGAASGFAAGFATGGPIGGAIGAFSGLLGSVFGPSQHQKVNDMRDAFVGQAGGIHELNVKAAEAGLSLDRLLGAKKVKDFDAAVKELEAGMAKFQERVKNLGVDLEKTLSSGSLLTADLIKEMTALSGNEAARDSIFAFITGQVQAMAEGLNTGVAGAVVKTVDDFNRLGVAVTAAFDAARAGGASVPQAFALIQPSIDKLVDSAKALGTNAEGALGELLDYSRLTETFGEVLDSVSGFGTQLTGLANLGMLSPTSFEAITGQIGKSIQQILDSGADIGNVLRLTQKELQTIWELQDRFGFSVDETTQKLIDEGAAAGIVGEQHKNGMDRAASAVIELTKRLDAAFTHLGILLPEAADRGAAGVNTELGKVNPDIVTDDVRYASNALAGWLPDGAWTGVYHSNIELGKLDPSLVTNDVQAARNALAGHLPDGARTGITGVNTEFARLDVRGVQEAVGDINWEFGRGIPDAASSGVTIVNTHMGRAEDSIGDVFDAAFDVLGTLNMAPESARDVATALDELRRSGVSDLKEIEDAINRILFGSSPGGFKEFGPMSAMARAAIRDLKGSALPDLAAIEGAVNDATHIGGRGLPARLAARVGAFGQSQDMETAVARGVARGLQDSGIRFQVDGRTFGRLAAEYVAEELESRGF